MHKHVDLHSPQTCNISITAHAEGTVSNSKADLSRYIPTVSNKNNMPDDSVHFAPIF